MRVVLNTRPLLFEKTGIGYYIEHLYRGLSESKEVQVYPTIDHSSTGTLRRLSRGAQVFRKVLGNSVLKLTIPLGDFLISKKESMYKTMEADIYHETNYDAIPRGRWKTVVTMYDLTFLKYPGYLPDEVVRKCRANIHALARADRVIVHTHAIKTEVMSLLALPGERIDVIPLAPSENCSPVDEVLSETPCGLERYTPDDYILHVGTIEPRKNIPVLLRAFKILREKHQLKLILAGGEGWLNDSIIRLPRELNIQNDVILTGYVDGAILRSLYHHALVLVCPSLYEGFGLPPLEAMACGTPVIISDALSLREVAGDAAMSFPTMDHEELAAQLEKVVTSNSLRQELIRKGLDRAGEYSWQRVIAETIRTYQKVLEH
jgi:glycosyltransferase involved in cell wall biosynthesis